MKIKFRAWVEEDKKLYPVVDINLVDEVVWVDTKGGFNFKDIILEPFTNAYDKNGNEIYVGDVLTYKEVYDGYWEVLFDNFGFRLQHSDEDDYHTYVIGDYMLDKMIIDGNIHTMKDVEK